MEQESISEGEGERKKGMWETQEEHVSELDNISTLETNKKKLR